MVAFGVGQWPHASSAASWDWKPLLLVVVSLLLLRFVMQLQVGWPTGLAAIGIGTLWGMLIDWWGIFMPTAVILLLVLLASSGIDKFRHRPV